jgi:hypothetical protein
MFSFGGGGFSHDKQSEKPHRRFWQWGLKILVKN